MKLLNFRQAVSWMCTLLLLITCHLPTLAASDEVAVHTDSGVLASDVAPFIDDGTTYVSLVAFARAMGEHTAVWDGTSAQITSSGLTISATPGQEWVQANGRFLHVPGQVRLVSGRTMVPVRTLAQAYGAQVTWDHETRSVLVTGGDQPLEHGDTYYDPDTLYWLSRVISAESRGEPLTGQIAVGNVVLNRLESSIFPNTLYGVIFQPGQFEPVENGTIYDEPYHLSIIAAKLCLEGAQVIGDCMYFFAPALSPGTWIVNNRTYYATIGCHRFYL